MQLKYKLKLQLESAFYSKCSTIKVAGIDDEKKGSETNHPQSGNNS